MTKIIEKLKHGVRSFGIDRRNFCIYLKYIYKIDCKESHYFTKTTKILIFLKVFPHTLLSSYQFVEPLKGTIV